MALFPREAVRPSSRIFVSCCFNPDNPAHGLSPGRTPAKVCAGRSRFGSFFWASFCAPQAVRTQHERAFQSRWEGKRAGGASTSTPRHGGPGAHGRSKSPWPPFSFIFCRDRDSVLAGYKPDERVYNLVPCVAQQVTSYKGMQSQNLNYTPDYLVHPLRDRLSP